MDSQQLKELSTVLYYADRWKFRIPPISSRRSSLSEKEGYEIQRHLISRYGAPEEVRAGYKMGGISYGLPPGAFGPHYGILLKEKVFSSGVRLDCSAYLEPGLEAETAVLLGMDLPAGSTAEEAEKAVKDLFPAFELVESRQQRTGKTMPDSLADNASFGACILGEPVPAARIGGKRIAVSVRRNGEEISLSAGNVSISELAEALLWLAAKAEESGSRLKAGDLILAGALTRPLVPLVPGVTVCACFDGLGEVMAEGGMP